MDAGAIVLEISQLSSGYNENEVLRGISIRVATDEIVAVIGPNGAGKSTLLKSIFNLCQVRSGCIVFDREEITRLPAYQLISRKISYVSQGRNIFSNMSVEENLKMGRLFGDHSEIVQEKIEEVFDIFPVLKEKCRNNAATLSGGEQQILAIARAFMQDCKLLLLDEPSLGLDPLLFHQLFEKIREINRRGVAVLLVEQNARQAINLAHRTYVVQEGKVVFEGTKESLTDPKLHELYFGVAHQALPKG